VVKHFFYTENLIGKHSVSNLIDFSSLYSFVFCNQDGNLSRSRRSCKNLDNTWCPRPQSWEEA